MEKHALPVEILYESRGAGLLSRAYVLMSPPLLYLL
jgi:hypothetical protein